MPEKRKWEFKKRFFNRFEKGSLVDLLNQYGQKGWQLAGFFDLPDITGQSELVFKRIKNIENNEWEYKINVFDRMKKETVEEFLNRNGKHGWELVDTFCLRNCVGKIEMIFKRLKIPKKA